VSSVEYSSVAETDEGRPICLTGIRLHILTEGASFDLQRRVAAPPPPPPSDR